MLTSIASSPIGGRPAVIAVILTSTIGGRCGGPFFGSTLANHAGSRPSRASENQMRAAASMNANTTLMMLATATAEIVIRTQVRPSAPNALATGASLSSVE